MKYSSDTIDTLYVGGDEVDKVYHGSDVAWQRVSPSAPALVQAMTGSWSGLYQYSGTLTTSTEIVFEVAAGAERWTQASLRLWNGSEAGNAGATQSGNRWSFASGGACRAWWDLYAVRVNVNSEGWQWVNTTNTQATPGGASQPAYLNLQPALTRTGWTDFGAGLTMDIEVWKL